MLKRDSNRAQEIRELVKLVERDQSIKVVGRGTVIRSAAPDNKRTQELAERLADKLVIN